MWVVSSCSTETQPTFLQMYVNVEGQRRRRRRATPRTSANATRQVEKFKLKTFLREAYICCSCSGSTLPVLLCNSKRKSAKMREVSAEDKGMFKWVKYNEIPKIMMTRLHRTS